MKLRIGSDHAGFSAKEKLKAFLENAGYEIEDLGTDSEASCDYPDFAGAMSEQVGQSEEARGILVCGTGIGMSIMANKFPGVRAALCHNEETARMSRAHNNANILCLGARVLELELLCAIALAWIETPFEGGRHAKRLEIIARAESRAARK